MTDDKKNTETEVTPAAKPTVKKKSEPKAKTKTKAADAAPYLKKEIKTPSSSQSPKGGYLTTLVLLVVAVAIVLITFYKFNEEHNSRVALADTLTTGAETEAVSADMKADDNIDIAAETPTLQIDVPPVKAEQVEQAAQEISTAQATQETQITSEANIKSDDQTIVLADQNTQLESQKQKSGQADNSQDLGQKRREAYIKEIQQRQQQYKKLMEARKQERAKTAEKLKEEYLRIKNNQLETRKKAQEIREQIMELNKKLHNLLKEAHTRKS